MKSRSSKGFTLVELIFYSAMVALLGAAATFFVFQMSDTLGKVRNKTLVLSEGRIAMDRMISEIKYSQTSYTPTSDFASNIGYASFVTTVGVPADEEYSFVDFYMSSGRLYLKREGQNSEALTSDRVAITRLKFTRMVPGTVSEGIMIELGLQENPRAGQPSRQVNVAFRSTAAMRGNK